MSAATAVATASTTPAITAPSSPAVGSPARGVPRRRLALLLAFAAAAVPGLQLAGTWTACALLLLAALIAIAVAAPAQQHARLAVVHWLPAGLALALTATTAIGLVASATPVPGWDGRSAALLSWALLVAVPATAAAVRGGRVQVAGSTTAMISTAAPLLLVAALLAVLPFEVWARIVNHGTDFARHVVMAVNTAADGGLDYTANAYPRSAHAAVGLLQQAAGDIGYTQTWQAVEGLLLLMLALTASAAAMTAQRCVRSVGGPRWQTIAAPAAVLILVLAGPLVAGTVSLGFLTTVEASLILSAAALLSWDGPRATTFAGLVMLTALMAHTWLLLLPLTALPAAWYGIRLWSAAHRRAPAVAAAVLGAAITAPALWVSLTKIGGIGAAAGGGETLLPGIGPAWLGLLILAGLGATAIRRSNAVDPAHAAMLLLLGLMVVMLLLLSVITDRSTFGSYYLIKSAWTPLPVLLALAVPGALWVLRITSGRVKAALAVALAAAAALVLPGTIAASADTLTGRNGAVAIVLPFLDQMHQHPGQDRELIVWGLAPHYDAGTVRRSVGVTDFVAASAAYVQGFRAADDAVAAMMDHDPVAMCRYLEAHPDALRVTGPHPEGPLQWLADAGCPDSVTDPETWTTIRFESDWYLGTRFAATPFGEDYATWQESRQGPAGPAGPAGH